MLKQDKYLRMRLVQSDLTRKCIDFEHFDLKKKRVSTFNPATKPNRKCAVDHTVVVDHMEMYERNCMNPYE